jgi:hypothetical protein
MTLPVSRYNNILLILVKRYCIIPSRIQRFFYQTNYYFRPAWITSPGI